MFHVNITFTQEWLAVDYQLYNHFLKILEQEIKRLESNILEMVFQNSSSYGKEALAEDVDQLRRMNKQLEEDCVLFTKGNHLGNVK